MYYIPTTCYSLFIYFISYSARLKQGALAHVLFIVSGGEWEIETERIRLSELWEETNEVIEAFFFAHVHVHIIIIVVITINTLTRLCAWPGLAASSITHSHIRDRIHATKKINRQNVNFKWNEFTWHDLVATTAQCVAAVRWYSPFVTCANPNSEYELL